MDPFQILGVERRGATVEKVRQAWKKLSLQYHPDKNQNQLEMANRMMAEINNAYADACDILAGKAPSPSPQPQPQHQPQSQPHQPHFSYHRDGPLSGNRDHENWSSPNNHNNTLIVNCTRMLQALSDELGSLKANNDQLISILFCTEDGQHIFHSILCLHSSKETDFWKIYKTIERCVYDAHLSRWAQEEELKELCALGRTLHEVVASVNRDIDTLQEPPKIIQKDMLDSATRMKAWAEWESNKATWNKIVNNLMFQATKWPPDLDHIY